MLLDRDIKMLSKIIKIALLCCFSKQLLAQEITTYDEVKSVIKKGKDINVVIDLTKCKGNITNKDYGRTIFFKPDSFAYIPKEHLISSTYRNFNIFHPEHLGKQIYEYYHIYILEYDDLIISETHLSAITGEQVSLSVRFSCQLGYSAKLFVDVS